MSIIKDLLRKADRLAHNLHDDPFTLGEVEFTGTFADELLAPAGDLYGNRDRWQMSIHVHLDQFTERGVYLQVGSVILGDPTDSLLTHPFVHANSRDWKIAGARLAGNTAVLSLVEVERRPLP